MLAAVLKGELATKQSIFVMRAFKEMLRRFSMMVRFLMPSVFLQILSDMQRRKLF